MAFNHPNAKSVWTTIEADQDGTGTIIVIETDIELNAESPAYNQSKVDDLVRAASAYASESSGDVDGIRIVPTGKGSA